MTPMMEQVNPMLQSSRDCIISVSFLNETRPLLLHITERLLAEDICLTAAQHCSITPVCRHLFALQSQDGLFLHPGAEFRPTRSGRLMQYVFRLRFRAEDPKSLQRIDKNAFEYLFFQTRSDFLNGRTLDLSKLSDSSIGMVVTDMVRLSMELNSPLDAVQKNVKNYYPKVVIKQLSKLKEPVKDAFNRAKNNANGNVTFVKEEYIKQVSRLDPDYGCEKFNVFIETEDECVEGIVTFNPFHEKYPGLIVCFQDTATPYHVCSIDELCHICINDCRVEINRRNGIPQYYFFKEKKAVHSFVSLLDGYYRLSCKWIFNLCKDMPTPSLVLLKNLKCHGPVSNDFSYAKLKKKGQRGCYILRESAKNYDEYKLDVCLSSESSPITFIITKNDSSEYFIKGKEALFPNVAVLRSHYHQHPILEDICLKICVPPSEYDEMDIMLCRSAVNINKQAKILAESENNSQPKCIPINAVNYPPSDKYIWRGRISLNSLAFLNNDSKKPTAVFTKSLLNPSDHKIRDFLAYVETATHMHCKSIVSTIGFVIKSSTLITEYFPYGPLNLFLQNSKDELQEVDLVEAASFLARALWYLEEHNYCHGRIRCSNIFVYKHEENTLNVKLGLPRIHKYTNDDLHWIPRECHEDLSAAESSQATDVWAFGTTLWEIFSYGKDPSSIHPAVTKDDYRRGVTLKKPENCNKHIDRLMGECWLKDPDDRKRPQAIMRDIHQTLYEVYNSRRNHMYSTMIPDSFSSLSISTDFSQPPEPPPKSSNLFTPQKRNPSALLKFAIDKLSRDHRDEPSNLVNSGNIQGSFTSLSSSNYNESIITDITTLSNSNSNNTATKLNGVQNDVGDICTRNVLKDVNEAKWLLDNNNIRLGTRLGQGFYGEVYMGHLLLWSGMDEEVVAIKKLKDRNDSGETKEQATKDLYDEIRIMKFLNHKNIVKIIGYTIEPELWLVMEYLPLGSLLNYVKQHKCELETQPLLNFAKQIGEGMEYLGTMNIVHRDLAARNVLVGDHNIVKISDFGLAKACVDKTYYSCNGTKCLPIRWYSLESIRFGKYSTKSDVWSYGITLWEIFSYGEEPIFETENNDDFIFKLQKGTRLSKPENCPLLMYDLLLMCWKSEPNERYTFKKIIQCIAEAMEFSP